MLRKVSLIAAALVLVAGPAFAAGKAAEPPEIAFSFEGPFGTYDQAQLQRGYKVYREVCSACHSMSLLSFRNLGDRGGPFYDKKYSPAHGKTSNDNPYVKAIAAEAQIDDLDNETGDPIKRPGAPADRFPKPFPNDIAARASNGGALPPDLSLIAKAREGGPEYIVGLLRGYVAPPKGLVVPTGQHYNNHFPGSVAAGWDEKTLGHAPEGGFIAMAAPLKNGLVTFDDGKPSTVNQMSEDVAAFLMWAAEPKLEERKQMGAAVIVFLLLFSGLLYASYRRVWRNESH
jgi:ubiquinol-cytochrome c reductase cytochrome c1 subunit